LVSRIRASLYCSVTFSNCSLNALSCAVACAEVVGAEGEGAPGTAWPLVADSPTIRAAAPATDNDRNRGEVGLGIATEAALLVFQFHRPG
jgi:hypothetical protein